MAIDECEYEDGQLNPGHDEYVDCYWDSEFEDGELNPGHDEYVDCYWDDEIKDFIPINGASLATPRFYELLTSLYGECPLYIDYCEGCEKICFEFPQELEDDCGPMICSVCLGLADNST